MNRRGQALFFIPAVLLFAAFVLVPLTRTFWNSFQADTLGGGFVGGRYYRFALTDPQFQQSLGNNVVYMLWTLLFEVAVGLVLAVSLERESRLNHFLRIAFFSPAVLSMVVIGLVFGFFLKEGIGLLPGMLGENRALLTISVISGWAYCGFYMVIFLGGLATIPREILEAASLDGANAWQTFWRVKLPMLKDVIFVAVVICVTGAFKAFDLFWVILPNQEHTSIVSTLLVKEVIKYDHEGYGSALAVILTALVLGAFGLVILMKKIKGGFIAGPKDPCIR